MNTCENYGNVRLKEAEKLMMNLTSGFNVDLLPLGKPGASASDRKFTILLDSGILY